MLQRPDARDIGGNVFVVPRIGLMKVEFAAADRYNCFFAKLTNAGDAI